VYWTDQSRVLTFGIAAVLGTIVGSAAMALAMNTFRWEGFTTTEDLVNHVAGGILMGFGGVPALGSFLAFFSIIAGCVSALKYQTWRIDRVESGALRRDGDGSTEARQGTL